MGDIAKARRLLEEALRELGPELPAAPLLPPTVDRRLLTVNFRAGRAGHRVAAIVDHISTGSMASMISWFNNDDADASSHYAVGKDGSIIQFVDDGDQAWHAGTVLRPTAPLVLERAGVNPNLWTIGIEHEGKAEDAAPDAQVQASARLHAWLHQRHGIPLDRRHVILHREVRADKSCPGRLPVDEILRLARGLVA